MLNQILILNLFFNFLTTTILHGYSIFNRYIKILKSQCYKTQYSFEIQNVPLKSLCFLINHKKMQ